MSRYGFPLLSPFFNPFVPIQPIPQTQPIQPIQPLTPPAYAGTPVTQHCICVPIGTCTGTVVPGTPTDGSGIIDIRIVNNVNNLFNQDTLFFFEKCYLNYCKFE